MVYRGKPWARTHRWADTPLKDEVWVRQTYLLVATLERAVSQHIPGVLSAFLLQHAADPRHRGTPNAFRCSLLRSFHHRECSCMTFGIATSFRGLGTLGGGGE